MSSPRVSGWIWWHSCGGDDRSSAAPWLLQLLLPHRDEGDRQEGKGRSKKKETDRDREIERERETVCVCVCDCVCVARVLECWRFALDRTDLVNCSSRESDGSHLINLTALSKCAFKPFGTDILSIPFRRPLSKFKI